MKDIFEAINVPFAIRVEFCDVLELRFASNVNGKAAG